MLKPGTKESHSFIQLTLNLKIPDVIEDMFLEVLTISVSSDASFKDLRLLKKAHQKLVLTDTGEDSKLVHRRIWPKVDALFSSLFSDASERRVENIRVHFWTFSPVSVNNDFFPIRNGFWSLIFKIKCIIIVFSHFHLVCMRA